ncbi:MAG TPA: aminoglycoside phosphotransferase family protein [Gammaproteobacteria bacterium]
MTGATGNSTHASYIEVPAPLRDALQRMGLTRADEPVRGVPMDGGVSSDIWRIDLESGAVCIKRALPKLKVTAEWRVPIERNAYESAWIKYVAEVAPDSVPQILGEDADAGAFVMRYLDPGEFPVWKNMLRNGNVDVEFAARVGDVLGRIHSASANRPDIAERFPTDANFFAIRLEPYLIAAAGVHPDCAHVLASLVDTTAEHRRVLVHGDVSPKNILIGPKAPMFLDAECAWYGDPAFDLAFCLNHLLLKTLWVPVARENLLAAYQRLYESYLRHTHWETCGSLAARTARLLPGLMLARVDGKSPVEYLDTDDLRNRVRRFARRFLKRPASDLAALSDAWRQDNRP